MRTVIQTMVAALALGSLAAARDRNDSSVPINQKLGKAAQDAIWSQNTALFADQIKAGLQINRPLDAEGKVLALNYAVTFNKPVMVKYLLEHGADPLARDADNQRAVDKLLFAKENESGPLLDLLKREPSDHDKKLLMGVPAPVWREVLGPPDWPDNLPPPKRASKKPASLFFVSINDADPLPELKPALDAHYPGWRPQSRCEPAEFRKTGDGSSSLYRDKQTHQHGTRVLITFEAGTSKQLKEDPKYELAASLRAQDLPAYKFRFTLDNGPLACSGKSGWLVQVAGYWILGECQGWES